MTLLIDGHDEGLWFTKGIRKRKKPPTCLVIHHTAGEGGAHQVFNVLKNRGLSVHFVIDGDGRITQMAQAVETVCFHAGSANEFSIGVEVANRGVPPAVPGHLREVYRQKFRGVERNFLAFYPRQVAAIWALCKSVNYLYGIPLVWPEDQMVMPQEALEAYRGILGHHHITQRKIDPSPRLWDDLAHLRALETPPASPAAQASAA